MNILIIGCGMFGFGLAKYLAEKFHNDPKTVIYSTDQDKAVIESLKLTHQHPYHYPGIKIPHKVNFILSPNDILPCIDLLVLAVPSQMVRDTVRNLKGMKAGTIVLNTAKSLELETNLRLSEVMQEEFSRNGQIVTLATFAGGTIANEFVEGAPLGADIACQNYITCKSLQKIFSSNRLRIYGNTDLIGVEYAAAFKSIIAILAGIISGLSYPFGSETHLISRASNEASKMAILLGASEHTFSMKSQCWGNDLWMSCLGNTRNRQFGIRIGQGEPVSQALEEMRKQRKIVEGYYTVKVAYDLDKQLGLNNLIFNEVYSIVYQGKNPKDSIDFIMGSIHDEIL